MEEPADKMAMLRRTKVNCTKGQLTTLSSVSGVKACCVVLPLFSDMSDTVQLLCGLINKTFTCMGELQPQGQRVCSDCYWKLKNTTKRDKNTRHDITNDILNEYKRHGATVRRQCAPRRWCLCGASCLMHLQAHVKPSLKVFVSRLMRLINYIPSSLTV